MDLNNYNKIGSANDDWSNNELVTVCKDCGNLFCLLTAYLLLSITKEEHGIRELSKVTQLTCNYQCLKTQCPKC